MKRTRRQKNIKSINTLLSIHFRVLLIFYNKYPLFIFGENEKVLKENKKQKVIWNLTSMVMGFKMSPGLWICKLGPHSTFPRDWELSTSLNFWDSSLWVRLAAWRRREESKGRILSLVPLCQETFCHHLRVMDQMNKVNLTLFFIPTLIWNLLTSISNWVCSQCFQSSEFFELWKRK